ncbi:MAG: SprB repeat-containing protein, partial [Bacteroidia bacterium]|nr:SprB repeat-containing protein [Bacteroidia bacterium]
MKKILYLGIIITSIKMHAQITASVITSASCFSPCTGSATFIATGGVPPYSYSVFPNTYSVQSSNVFYGLCPISYSYAVCDALFN